MQLIPRDQGGMIGNQLQAARALAGLTQAQVAQAAGVSIPTVKRAEGTGKFGASDSAVASIRAALEAAGVEFIAENGVGVRIREGK